MLKIVYHKRKRTCNVTFFSGKEKNDVALYIFVCHLGKLKILIWDLGGTMSVENRMKASALNELMFFNEFSTVRLESERKRVFVRYSPSQVPSKYLIYPDDTPSQCSLAVSIFSNSRPIINQRGA